MLSCVYFTHSTIDVQRTRMQIEMHAAQRRDEDESENGRALYSKSNFVSILLDESRPPGIAHDTRRLSETL